MKRMPLPDDTLRLEIIESPEALSGLESEWRALWQQDIRATPFQSPEWLLPWLRHIAEGELLAIAGRRGSRLVGLLPLYIYAEPGAKAGDPSTCRKLLLLGAGTSDYLGGVFEPIAGDAAAEAALELLFHARHPRENLRRRFDEVHLHQLPGNSPLLRGARGRGWAEVSTDPCLRVELSTDGRLEGRLEQNLRYYQRRAERRGEVRFHTADAGSAVDVFESLLALHARRWQARGEPGVLASERVQAAHRAALPALVRQGLVRLYSLTLDETTIAVNYCLVDPPGRSHRALYYYLNGFDPEFSELSPGTLLLGHAAREAAREGAGVLDLLRGEERYKELWGAKPWPTYGVAAASNGTLEGRPGTAAA